MKTTYQCAICGKDVSRLPSKVHGRVFCSRDCLNVANRIEHPRTRTAIPPAVRFWAKVRKTDGCWLWTGFREHSGYGKFRINRSTSPVPAHRFSYELENGPISDPTLIVRHTCDNPPCVNPAHLLIGTKLDNAHDRDSRGRSGVVGVNNPHAKLTEDQVREIRRRYTGAWGEMSPLMREFGITAPAFYAIVRRTGWKHVAD